jgi:hypothetical protein
MGGGGGVGGVGGVGGLGVGWWGGGGGGGVVFEPPLGFPVVRFGRPLYEQSECKTKLLRLIVVNTLRIYC